MPLADRFAEYVSELHEISDSYRIRHGNAGDLLRLLEALRNSPDFAEDFGREMRSIVLREHFRPSETDLVTLVAVAWAGAEPDESTPQFSDLIHELRGVLTKVMAHRVLAHRDDRPIPISGEDSGGPEHSEGPEHSKGSEDSKASEDQKPLSPPQDPVSLPSRLHAQNGKPSSSGEVPREPEQPVSIPNSPPHEAPATSLTAKEDTSRILVDPQADRSAPVSEDVPASRFDPSAAEILAMGLTGLVVALLFSVGSLPVYRARVSVFLPTTISITTDAGANPAGPLSGILNPGSQDSSPLKEELKEKVADRLLAWPHPKPILRQDVLSRGMRDLHLGETEPILYADLVAETARQVRVTHLEPQNLYAITCDSWDARFAAIFCNELTNSLDADQPSGATSSPESAAPGRTIDAAVRPGNQVYPHWYLQGSAGLAIGCLLGVLVGFIKRPSKPAPEDDPHTEDPSAPLRLFR
jgi:hypothetical protein